MSATTILRAMVNDEAFAELCQSIGEEPQWLKDARKLLSALPSTAPTVCPACKETYERCVDNEYCGLLSKWPSAKAQYEALKPQENTVGLPELDIRGAVGFISDKHSLSRAATEDIYALYCEQAKRWEEKIGFCEKRIKNQRAEIAAHLKAPAEPPPSEAAR